MIVNQWSKKHNTYKDTEKFVYDKTTTQNELIIILQHPWF